MAMASARDVANDLLRRLLAGERGDLPLHLSMLLEKSSPLHDSDSNYREILPPELADLQLSPEARDEIIARLCAEVSRNPDADLVSAASATGSELATKAVVEILLNPPRPLTVREYGVALSVLRKYLPFRLAEDWEYLPKAHLERLVQLARGLRNADETWADVADRAARFTVSHHAAGLDDQLTELGYSEDGWPLPPGFVIRRSLGRGGKAQGEKSPDPGRPDVASSAREIATDLLRRLLAGERGRVLLDLGLLLEKSSPMDKGDAFYRHGAEHFRELGFPDLGGLRLSPETRDEIIAALCAEVSRNPDGDLMSVASSTASGHATKTIAKVLVDPPRPLTIEERMVALMVVRAHLPYYLAEDPEFLSKADLDRLVRLAEELRNIEENGTDEAETGLRMEIRYDSAALLNQLRRLRIAEK